MRIVSAEGTPLFAATAAGPRQIVRVTLADVPASGRLVVRVEGPGVSTRQPFRSENPAAGQVAEIPVIIAAPHRPGSSLPVTAVAETADSRAEHATEITVAEPGWTIWMVCHFHYDPVWWNTQGGFTQSQVAVPGEDGRLPHTRSAFELVRLHLDAARDDPDYKFVLAEVDYLKPYFDVHPEDRAELRGLIAAGRAEIVGGAYNEPNTNLTCAESTIRNIVYGLGHQRDVLGADPSVAWALDAFGHDPSYPGLMAAAGMTASAWARGPYHQWGPRRTVGDNARMQFPSEFEWMSPDGSGLLTSYMPNHYGAGWGLHQAADLPAARAEALAQFAELAPVAATRNVLLPVGADHVIPARWATAVHRDFAARYAWPRCVTGLPSEFFAAVRADAAERGIWLTPQTRDMNPVYPGKDVSYIDTKQAQRAAEVAVCDGERLATLAWLAGARYPAESLDKAWRQLVFGAHHDAITGTESDQVYLDLLGGWREAFERGGDARTAAAGFLAGRIRTIPPNGTASRPSTASRPIVVFNTLSWPRPGLATVTLVFGEPGREWLALADESGTRVPFLAEGIRRHPDGSLASAVITFRADVPALGYRTYWAHPAAGGAGRSDPGDAPGWADAPGTVIRNGVFEVEADAARGGALTRILDRRTGTELLRGLGNELVLAEEYGAHPRWGEGPWLLCPKGPGLGSGGVPASVRAQRCPAGSRLVAEFSLGDIRARQETILWDGIGRVEFCTHVDSWAGSDRLLRARFAARVPGGLPVFQTAAAVVGRPFGLAGTDVAEHPFTLDNPAHEWFGLGSTARVRAGDHAWAVGVAEIILPGPGARPGDGGAGGWQAATRALVAALASAGVTATCTRADGPRYGALDLDSNLPDVRIALGGPGLNPWTGRLLATFGPRTAARLTARLSAPGGPPVWIPAARPRAAVFTPSADVRAERDLPVLILAGEDLRTAVAELTRDLADAVIEAELAEETAAAPGERPPGPPDDRLLAGHSVALLNRGTPGSLVTPDGTMHMALMRASSAWPCGVWIDGPRRTAPDGSSFAWQHWSHTFRYALAAGAGDWRDARLVMAGQEYNHDLLSCATSPHDGPLPPAASLCEVAAPPHAHPAVLSALKPRGYPLASGQPGQPQRETGVAVRLRDGGSLPGDLVRAQVSLFTPITAARLTDLTERSGGPAADVTAGSARVTVPPAGTATVALAPARADPPAAAGPPPARAARAGQARGGAEPAQPVFTRYWLHGTGPAPVGNLPVTVHLSPERVALGTPGSAATSAPRGLASPAGLCVTVACGPAGASGQVTLDVPPGLAVSRADSGPSGPFSYSLPARGHRRWDLSVRARPGTGPGRYFLAARITDDLGQILEDAALITIGEPPAPAAGLARADLLPLLEADRRAQAAEVELALEPAAVHVAPGECAALALRLANRTASVIRGECQLLSPFGSWHDARPWTRGFAAGPGETVVLDYTVAPPADARPGAQWWALAKVMYFGRACYSECAHICVAG